MITFSKNWINKGRGEYDFGPNKAHSFVRITLFNAVEQVLSRLHFVDLIGNPPLHTPQTITTLGNKLENNNTALEKEQEIDRTLLSQQLLSFSRVITELAKIDPIHKGMCKFEK